MANPALPPIKTWLCDARAASAAGATFSTSRTMDYANDLDTHTKAAALTEQHWKEWGQQLGWPIDELDLDRVDVTAVRN